MLQTWKSDCEIEENYFLESFFIQQTWLQNRDSAKTPDDSCGQAAGGDKQSGESQDTEICFWSDT